MENPFYDNEAFVLEMVNGEQIVNIMQVQDLDKTPMVSGTATSSGLTVQQ